MTARQLKVCPQLGRAAVQILAANDRIVFQLAPHLKAPPQLNRMHSRPEQARAGLAESAARCSEMLAEALGGGGRVQKARKCWAICFLMKPTIEGRCVCSRISSDSRCRTRWGRESGIGKSCGRSAGGPAAPPPVHKGAAGTWPELSTIQPNRTLRLEYSRHSQKFSAR